MKISRICSEFEYGDWVIHKFGVDDSGDQVHQTDKIKDWFYFKTDKLELLSAFKKLNINTSKKYKSLFGDDVTAIEYSSLKEKKVIDENFPDFSYEADVPPEFKYILLNKEKWSNIEDRHLVYFDIECWADSDQDLDAAQPERTRAPITAISTYSTKFKKYFMFSWHPEQTAELTTPKFVEKDDTTYVFCKTEREIITAFLFFVHDYNVDLITGWYSANFDLPYIINRAAILGIDTSVLSPLGRVKCYKKGEFWRTYITGLDHIDMLEAVQDLGYNLSNYKLSTAAKEILEDPEMEKLTDVGWKDWKDNYGGFLKYSKRDVELLKRIDEKKGIFSLYVMIQKLTNITGLNEVMYKSSVVDKYILSECNNEFIFPTRITQSRQPYMGAIVLDPREPGLHENVAVFDFASLYPTSIMSFNLSPETYITSEEQLLNIGKNSEYIIEKLKSKGFDFVDTQFNEELFGKRYFFYAHSHKIGLLPRILKKMYAERRLIKAKMKKLDKHSEEYGRLDKHQNAIKIILNSAYGAMGFPYFRLYTPEVADAITYFAREALLFAVKRAEEDGFGVLYGDTDSVMAKKLNRTNEDVQKWVDDFNSSLTEKFVKKYNFGVNKAYSMLELEFEKDLEFIYFGDAKKRYYAIVRPEGDKYIRGLNIIRKDAPAIVKTKLDELAELAVRNKLTSEVLMSFREEIKSLPIKEIGITKRFGKRFDQYKKNKPQHLTASLWANEILGCSITHRDIPYLFYVVSKCEEELKPRLRHNTICLLEEQLSKISDYSNLFTIDYDMWFEKQILDQLDEFEYIESVMVAVKECREVIKNESK